MPCGLLKLISRHHHPATRYAYVNSFSILWWISLSLSLSHSHEILFFCYRSAFIIFCRDKRPLLKEQKPNASVGDIAKELGKAWRIMTEDQKEPYEKEAKEDRERYEEEKESYVPPDENDMEDDEEDEDED